jgi:hypothetical protein
MALKNIYFIIFWTDLVLKLLKARQNFSFYIEKFYCFIFYLGLVTRYTFELVLRNASELQLTESLQY